MNIFLKRVKKIQLKRAYKIENWYAARQGKAAGEAETDASFKNQVQAWHEEVDRARQGQRDAKGKLFSLEVTEVQKMRVEMASMKRDVEHYSRQVIFSILQEHMELRKSYRELTDLLSQKRSWVYRILCCSAFCSHLEIVEAAALRSCSNLFYPTRDNEAMA
ncbi:hypothetical protein ACFX2K_028343 [Malus domestica]